MDTLTQQALNWALTHIRRFGDTDILPGAFEFAAVAHAWTWLRIELESRDLAIYGLRPHRYLLVPKPGGGFRVVVQLDPLDTIVYTALVYEMAELIERHRIPAAQRVACSYRIQLDDKGSFFGPDNGWRDFHTRSTELAQQYSHVLVADIADFYNQISHHRLRNALETAGVQPDRAANTENILSQITTKQSRGIPVGPYASIVLAEASLHDVDLFLVGRGRPHLRYVDDFRVFCTSRREANSALHDLSSYLHTAHRLTLQFSKTRILSVTDFVASELEDPQEREERTRVERLNEILQDVIDITGYMLDLEALDDATIEQAVRENLLDLFVACLGRTPLPLGLVRYLLRRATYLRTIVLKDVVFGNLEVLAPAFREVAGYLKGIHRWLSPEQGAALAAFLQGSDMGHLPFLRTWGLDILTHVRELRAHAATREIAAMSQGELGLRPLALLAKHEQDLAWVRERKETWGNNSPWDRRAIIWASTALPRDERNPWLRLVEQNGDHLDRAVAQLAGIEP